MSEYIIAVCVCAVIGGGIRALVPSGRARGAVALLCSLCTVACILQPLVDAVTDERLTSDLSDMILKYFETDGDSSDTYDEIYNKAILRSEIANAELSLKTLIIQDLSLESEAFDINMVLGEGSGEKYIELIEIIIYKSGISIDPHALKKYINTLIECKCDVVYR